jgi:hypothetical protein
LDCWAKAMIHAPWSLQCKEKAASSGRG